MGWGGVESLVPILCCLRPGRFPFNDTSHSLLFQKIKIGQFPVPPEDVCSQDAVRLLRHLLHMSPAERPTAVMLYPLLRAMLAQHVTNTVATYVGCWPLHRGVG